jgi:hypothetical protein
VCVCVCVCVCACVCEYIYIAHELASLPVAPKEAWEQRGKDAKKAPCIEMLLVGVCIYMYVYMYVCVCE